MKIIAAILTVLTLAACGVDGAPSQPEPSPTGVSVSGDARIGVVGRV